MWAEVFGTARANARPFARYLAFMFVAGVIACYGVIDENTILIGHSSGAVAAMRYAETHRLLGSILVGVCHTDLGDSGEAASGYYSAPWRWDHIRDHQQWIAIYHSVDDPHIPVAEPRFVAAQLKCQYFEFEDRGHFLDAGALPEAVPYLKRKLGLPSVARAASEGGNW